MSKVRVIENVDGTLSIIHPAPKSKFTEQECLDRSTPQGATYEDIDSSELPSSKDKRYAWRKKQSGGVKVDNAIKDPQETKKNTKKNAKNKLKALGLTQEEVDAIIS